MGTHGFAGEPLDGRAVAFPADRSRAAQAVITLLGQAIDGSTVVLAVTRTGGWHAVLVSGRLPVGRCWRLPDPLWTASRKADPVIVVKGNDMAGSAVLADAGAGGAIAVELPDEPHGDGPETLIVMIEQTSRQTLASAVPLAQQAAATLLELRKMNRDALELRRAVSQLTAEAMTDPLTGLANRRGLRQCIAAHEGNIAGCLTPVGVAMIDVDGLKGYNDRYGHAAGDELLRRTAAALRAATSGAEVVARAGGDEFVVLAPGIHDAGLLMLERRIRAALADHGVAAAVGVGMSQEDGTVDAAWHRADLQMYQAKRQAEADRAVRLEPTG